MKPTRTFRATDRDVWRAWLAENHAEVREVWLLFAKKHTGVQLISYEEAVEEALCFGWIDSTAKRIDDAMYVRKFTPRTNNENWSELNRKRAEKCIREGRMTELGLAKIRFSNTPAQQRPPQLKNLTPPPFMTKALKENPEAWQNFAALAPSHQRNYTLWITTAKREETRERRLNEAVRLLARNKKLGPK